MIFIWGSRLYGRVDDMPGGLHVATKFGHLWFIPLIPMGSTLVIEKDRSQYRGVPIPMSFKSILLAWTQAALIVAGIALIIVGLSLCGSNAPRHRPDPLVGGLCAGAGLVALIGTWGVGRLGFIRRASYARAVQLAEHAGMSEEGLIMIEAAYGRISAEEAQAALNSMAEMEQAVRAESASASPATPPMAPTAGARRPSGRA